MSGPNIPDNPDGPSIGNVAGQVASQIDALSGINDTREDWQDIEAARLAAREAVAVAMGKVAALVALSESSLVPKTQADFNLAMQAGAVFHETSKGSAQESIHRAVQGAIDIHSSALVEYDDATVIAQVGGQVAQLLLAAEVDLTMIGGRSAKSLEQAGEKLKRRDRTVNRAQEYVDKIT